MGGERQRRALSERGSLPTGARVKVTSGGLDELAAAREGRQATHLAIYQLAVDSPGASQTVNVGFDAAQVMAWLDMYHRGLDQSGVLDEARLNEARQLLHDFAKPWRRAMRRE